MARPNKPVHVDHPAGKKTKSRRNRAHWRKGTQVTTSDKAYIKEHYRNARRNGEKIKAVVKRAKGLSLAQKRDLPMRDKRVLQRRGLL